MIAAIDMQMMIDRGREFYDEARAIWVSGGWAMLAIAAAALVMFAIGMNLYLKLRAKGFASVSEKKWRRWIDHPAERRGPIGDLLDEVDGASTIKQMGLMFEELRHTEVAPLQRELLVMRICVGVAPLLGLLGTVTGMLATFHALATGSGGDKTMGMVAGGISEALITTMTGLVIALPGLFFQYQMQRKYERYKAFLAHLETVCTQKLYRKLRQQETKAAA